MQALLNFIKKILPKAFLKKIRPFGHGFLAYLAAAWYGFPSRKMVVIGVTGTAGKSTTIQMLAKILNVAGKKTGYSTTVSYSDGEQERINPDGMSMAGRFRLQGYLRAMAERGCTHAIVEATSEGLAQNRHFGIEFDVCIITMLAPVHIDAHGNFENYKRAKGKLFAALEKSARKSFFPHKFIGANLDNEFSDFYLSFRSDKKFGTTLREAGAPIEFENTTLSGGSSVLEKQVVLDSIPTALAGTNSTEVARQSDAFAAADVTGNISLVDKVYAFQNLVEKTDGLEFTVNGTPFSARVPGKFNAYNAALAIATANMLGVSLENCSAGLAQFNGIAGRMQKVLPRRGASADASGSANANASGASLSGASKKFDVYLDYAAAPVAMKASLEAFEKMPHARIIHAFGSPGGHRDKGMRFEFGEISARHADVMIIMNEDVYDSDPQEIADNIREGAMRVPEEQRKAKEIITILSRRDAIKKAIEIARSGDIVLVTGKGIEQFLFLPGNKRIDWDDKKVIEEYLG